MAYVEMARGCLLPEAIVLWRQVRCPLNITCRALWLYLSFGGLASFPDLLEIKCPFSRSKGQARDWTHIDTNLNHNFPSLVFQFEQCLKKLYSQKLVCAVAVGSPN